MSAVKPKGAICACNLTGESVVLSIQKHPVRGREVDEHVCLRHVTAESVRLDRAEMRRGQSPRPHVKTSSIITKHMKDTGSG